ncbi:sigma-54-dependent Fis family transcriptional regulator [candidate division KSB1 bacterium]|nr:sigma-54-dependent Fis family transcriptional regulator [candidate division KSB1 bacterium]
MNNILLVEDEPDILNIFSEQLTRWGYNPIVADNGEKGIAKYQESPIDLVITDIKMPSLDGTTLLKRIKEIDRDAVVIMVTGYPSIDSAVLCMKDGAFDYLVKPINIDELKIKIEKGLEKKQLLKTISLWKGVNWSLIVSIPIWLILGIILAKIL